MEFLRGSVEVAGGGLLGVYGMIVGLAVDGGGNLVRVGPDMLHDVHLAASGPAAGLLRHHPEGRPGAQSCGQLEPGLEVAVGPVVGGVDAGGINPVPVLDGAYLERSVAYLGGDYVSLLSGDVGLELVVHPSGLGDLVPPLLRVGKAASGRVELVLPNQGVAERRFNLRLHIARAAGLGEVLSSLEAGPYQDFSQAGVASGVEIFEVVEVADIELREIVV